MIELEPDDKVGANKRLRLLNNEQKRIGNQLQLLSKDRYEQQLLKYFDFAGWIKNVLEGKNKRTELLNE